MIICSRKNEKFLYKHHYTKFKFELKQRKTKIKELCPFVYRPPKKKEKKMTSFIHERTFKRNEESYKLLFKYLYID